MDNKPGAGSMLSAQLLLKAPADGYNLMWGGSGNLGIAPYLYKSAGYTSANRLPAIDVLRDVPAVSEFIPKYECVAWTALVGPAGLPEDVKTRLADGVRKSAQSHAMRTKFEQMGNFVDPIMTMERSREDQDRRRKV